MPKDNNITTSLPKYFTSKEAEFILAKGYGRCWWFDFGDTPYSFFTIDYIPENYPHLEVNFHSDTKENGYKRIKEMTENEGWEFLHGEDTFISITKE